MTQAIVQTYTTANENRAKITGVVIALCISMAMYYGFNVYKVISKTVTMQSDQSTLSQLSSSVGTLNAQYLQLSSSITPDKFKSYGLSQGKVSQYISRGNSSMGNVALLRQ